MIIRQLTDFKLQNKSALETYQKSLIRINKEIDKEIEDLYILENEKEDDQIDAETQEILDDLIDELIVKNKTLSNEISDINLGTLKILSDTEKYLEGIKDNGSYTTLKNSIMQEATNLKEENFKISEQIRIKLNKIAGIVKSYGGSEDLSPDKNLENKINDLINKKINDLVTGDLKIPLEQLNQFSQLDTCNSVECLKEQIKYMQKTIVNQNIAIEKISNLITDQLNSLNNNIKTNSAKYDEIKSYVENIVIELNTHINSFQSKILNRINLLDEQNTSSSLQKYY